MTIAEFITEELARQNPGRLLVLDETAREWASAFLAMQPSCQVLDAEAPDIALALIGDTLNTLERPKAIQLLGRLIRISPVVLAASRENQPLEFNDFLSLGMQRLHGPDAGQWCVYGFDLYSYKQVPDWLNAKYWANPELWEP